MKNKKLIFNTLLQLTLVIILSSCGKAHEKQAAIVSTDSFHSTDTLIAIYENPKITEYKAALAQLDSLDMNSATVAVAKYKEIFAGQTNLLCDTGFVLFQAMYDSLEQTLSNKHQLDTTNYEILVSKEQTKIPQKLKDYRKNLTTNGFRISTSEGVTFIEQDRSFIAQNFYSFVTPVMKDYLVELQKENKEGFAQNNAISISPKQLVDRNIWYEKFVYENPTFIFIENCKTYQKAYFSYLMYGYGNTALYKNEETKEMSEFYISAYNYLISKYKGSVTAENVQPYFDALKLKQTDKVQTITKNYHIKGLIFGTKI